MLYRIMPAKIAKMFGIKPALIPGSINPGKTKFHLEVQVSGYDFLLLKIIIFAYS